MQKQSQQQTPLARVWREPRVHRVTPALFIGFAALITTAGCHKPTPAATPKPAPAPHVAEKGPAENWGGVEPGQEGDDSSETRTLAGLKETLNKSMPMFLDCYEREGSASSRGPLLLRVVFDTRGEVVDVAPQPSSGLSPVILTCAVLTAWRLQLPTLPKESIVVTIALDYPGSKGDGPKGDEAGEDGSISL